MNKLIYDPRNVYEDGILPDSPAVPSILSTFIQASKESSKEVLAYYAKNRYLDIKIAIANNINASSELLSQLLLNPVIHPDYIILQLVIASNINTPVDTLVKLLSHTSSKVKIRAAQSILNKDHIPNQILEQAEKILNDNDFKADKKDVKYDEINKVISYVKILYKYAYNDSIEAINKKIKAAKCLISNKSLTPQNILLQAMNFLTKIYKSQKYGD